LFKESKRKELPLSRVHLHPYGSFLMCYDQSKWHDAGDAIIKASIAVPKYCQTGGMRATPEDWLVGEEENYEVSKMPA